MGGALEEGVVVAETVDTEGVVVVEGQGKISVGRGEVVVEAARFKGAERAGISKCASIAVARVSGRSVHFHPICIVKFRPVNNVFRVRAKMLFRSAPVACDDFVL
jgi:hypothetical protein